MHWRREEVEKFEAGFVLALICGALAIWTLTGGQARGDTLEAQHELSMEFQTPHTDWAQPYARGKTTVLFFSSGRATQAREIIELMQRFDIEAEAAYWDFEEYKDILGSNAGHERLLKLLEKPFDCYLFNAVPLGNFSPEEQYKILQRVTEGAGIVMVGGSDDRIFKVGNRIERRPAFLADRPGEAFTVLKGRGVRMPARPQIAYGPGWQVQYDYWQEALGRAVLWAAAHEPRMSLEVKADSKELAREKLPSRALAVAWRSAPAPVRVRVRLRRQDGLIVYEKEAQPERKAGELRYEIPVVRAGRYYVEAWTRSDRGIECWATGSFEVKSGRDRPSLELAKGWGEIGEQITGSVKLTKPLAAGEKLRVQVLDRRERILARTFPKVSGGRADFTFPIGDWMPMLLRVEAGVTDAKGEVVHSYSYFRVTKRHRGQFNFLVWDYARDTLFPYAEESLARLGTTIQLAGGNPPLGIAAYDIAWVPYTTRIMSELDKNGVMRPTCWNNEPAIDEYVKKIAQSYVASRQHGVFAYSLGDEVATKGSCVHPACIKAYQRYLKEQYGTIEALNTSWGSSYKSFEEVALLDPKDNDAAVALRQKNYPRWYDRQAFKSYNQVKFCQRFAREFRKSDPEAVTGFEGAGRMAGADDYDLIVRSLGFWSPYPEAGDEIIRSIAAPDFITGNWMGYAKEADPLLRKYWRMVLRGKNVVQWWRWDSCGNRSGDFHFHGVLAPHLGPYPAVEEMVEDTRAVREGLGTILMRSEMLDDGVAILYSLPSAYASRIEPGSHYGRYVDDHVAWHRTIREAGLQFRYVTDGMLRRGEFDPERFKLLILARAEAVGPKEARAIRQFVERGGALLADTRPALYDHHLKSRPSGALDELLGIERDGRPKASIGTAEFKCSLGGENFDFAVERVKYDPGVRLSGAEALGRADGTPLVIRRKVGKGQALLLNFTLASYPDLRHVQNEQVARFVEKLFASLGMRPALTMKGTDGSAMRDVEMVRWRNGDIEIIALSPVEGGKITGIAPLEVGGVGKTIAVTLPEARHIYNLRERKYLGQKRTFTAAVRPARATFCVLTGRQVPTAAITLNPSSASPGQVVSAALRVPGAEGKHALRIRATTPDGNPAEWLDQVVIVGRESEAIAIPIAFNDPLGKWTISAIDLYSNEAVTATLTVR